MKNLRRYGNSPFDVAVIHGGPGAAGEMAPVALELASGRGVLEPLQTAASLKGQVDELRTVLEQNGDVPVTLIGFSWGAWLSFIVAARYPLLVKKLILVASGPYEEKYVARLQESRLSRLGEKERAEFESTIRLLGDSVQDQDGLLARLGVLTARTDEYDPIADGLDRADLVSGQGNIFQNVWRDAADMRRSGRLVALAKQIKCPVVALHGDYDPHPAEGVQDPLSAALERFRFVLLNNCGHRPWMERQAGDEFYRVLREELR